MTTAAQRGLVLAAPCAVVAVLASHEYTAGCSPAPVRGVELVSFWMPSLLLAGYVLLRAAAAGLRAAGALSPEAVCAGPHAGTATGPYTPGKAAAEAALAAKQVAVCYAIPVQLVTIVNGAPRMPPDVLAVAAAVAICGAVTLWTDELLRLRYVGVPAGCLARVALLVPHASFLRDALARVWEARATGAFPERTLASASDTGVAVANLVSVVGLLVCLWGMAAGMHAEANCYDTLPPVGWVTPEAYYAVDGLQLLLALHAVDGALGCMPERVAAAAALSVALAAGACAGWLLR